MALGHVEIALLAGGRGTRMRHHGRRDFQSTPKVFLRISHGGRSRSLFSHALSGVISLGPGGVSVLASRHPDSGPHLIADEISGLGADGLRIAVLWEPPTRPLGTAGALYRAASASSLSTLVAVPADTVFPYGKLPDALGSHGVTEAEVTWVVTTNPGPIAQNAGYLIIDPGRGCLVFSREDPNHSLDDLARLPPGLVEATSTGVVIFDAGFFRRHFRLLRRRLRSGPVDIYRDLMPFLLGGGQAVAVFDVGEPAPDLGTPERLLRFEQSTSQGAVAWD